MSTMNVGGRPHKGDRSWIHRGASGRRRRGSPLAGSYPTARRWLTLNVKRETAQMRAEHTPPLVIALSRNRAGDSDRSTRHLQGIMPSFFNLFICHGKLVHVQYQV
jgi:hypothetical protein